MFEYLPYSKEQQLASKRVKHTQRQLGDISPAVRAKVNERSGDFCERCGKHKLTCWTLENAHVDGRRVIGHKTTEYDLARLCGPSTKSGTCHHWVTSTREGHEWMKSFRERLMHGA